MANLHKFLTDRAHLEWESVKAELEASPYYLTVKEDDTLVLFMYDQIRSDFSLPIVQDSRGIILERGSWNFVCRPFTKFFNYGEVNAAQIDWSTAKVQEKLDGSIMKMYFYRETWRVASNSCIYALEDFEIMFRECAEQYVATSWPRLDPAYTYIFELIHPSNQVVVRYKTKRLVLIGVRENASGKEVEPAKLNLSFDLPHFFPFTSLDQSLEFVNSEDFRDEGFVVVDANFNRIKKLYLKMAMAKAQISDHAGLVMAVIKNEVDEYLTYFPEDKPEVESIREKVNLFTDEMIFRFKNTIMVAKTRKEFAVSVNTTSREYSRILFKFYDIVCRDRLELEKTNPKVKDVIRDFWISQSAKFI